MEILLGEKKNKMGINEDNFMNVELSSDVSMLPCDSVVQNFNVYEQYLKEKDASTKYRLAFTVSPFCSNVLFNKVSEIVYHEGGSDCIALGTSSKTIPGTEAYVNEFKKKINRQEAIRDTAYSHPEIGGLVYHCGVDIFNNHHLRKRGFSVVNIGGTGDETFNTIRDKMRDRNGATVREKDIRVNKTADIDLHLYQIDDIKPFLETVKEGLIEDENGWFGFINPTSIEVPTYGERIINKCMNNNKACEQYDMYPDRSLYSFIPKYNKYRDRYEKNWDYCLTYPAENDYENDLIKGGLKAVLKESNERYAYFRTSVRNNLANGDIVRVYVDGKVMADMYANNVKADNSFSLIKEEFDDRNIDINELKDIRIVKIVRNLPCSYYIRKFKKIDGTDNGDTLSKLAFSNTVYGDKNVQILYNRDIDVNGLVDNLGRSLSEIYLTIIKRNKGYEKWYGGDVKNSSIEFSHCFGQVDSGFDLADNIDDFNVRKIHNIDINSVKVGKDIVSNYIPKKVKKLEEKITIDNDLFDGDIVEFSPAEVKETVLEYVYHRFNTYQREFVSNEYSGITYDDILRDDYDESGWSATTKVFNMVGEKNAYPVNLSPEGYFYNPHYCIKLKKYADRVQQSSHERMGIAVDSISNTEVRLNKNYTPRIFPYSGLTYGGVTFDSVDKIPDIYKIYYFNENGEKFTGTIVSVTGNTVSIVWGNKAPDKITRKGKLFKHNYDKPDMSYELNDGTGRYLWREVLSSSQIEYGDELYDTTFTNGSTYIHKNINFYLRRQDPVGEFSLNNVSKMPTRLQYINPVGKKKEYDNIDFYQIEEFFRC